MVCKASVQVQVQVQRRVLKYNRESVSEWKWRPDWWWLLRLQNISFVERRRHSFFHKPVLTHHRGIISRRADTGSLAIPIRRRKRFLHRLGSSSHFWRFEPARVEPN